MNFSLIEKFCISAVFTSLLTLAACGGDGSSSSDEKNDSSIAEVESFDDLVHCTKSHFGEVRRVLEIDSIYQCTADGWVAIDSSEISNSSSSLAKSSSSIKASASETEKIEKKKVESVNLSGFAQIGPFASETSVSVYGLDASLATIKTKFSGKTSGDSGRFEISGISFDNQYAQVEVSGYFMNMLTGKTTSGTRSKLHAIVDLSESKKVKANVNLFTEMEQARVNNLVLNEKFNVPAAKVRATKEILKLFDVKAPDGLTSTAVSLADTGKVGAALYATMVMMQADLSISKFNSRFDDFVEDFAEDGSFDDAELRAAIADYLSGIDDGFSAIRSSMERVVKKVPNFEKLLVNFWTSELGLGECTDSLETSIVKVSNKNSSLYHKGFACTSRRWHLSTELDAELGLCTAKMEGEFKESNLEKSPKYYSCQNGTWKEISKTAYELKSCTEKRENEYVKAKSGEMFVCLGKQWLELDSVAYELKVCTEKREGEFAKTKSKDYFHCENKEWVSVTAKDAEANAVCNESSKGSVVKNSDGDYFACDGKSWSMATSKDYKVGIACNEKNKDKKVEKGDSHYFCNGSEWKDISADEFTYGFCSETENNLKVVEGVACENSKWRKASAEEQFAHAVCNKDNASYDYDKWFFNADKDSAVICYDVCDIYCENDVHSYEFRYVTEGDLLTKKICSSDAVGEMQNDFTCAPLAGGKYGWRATNAGEKATEKYCGDDNFGEVLKGYACDEGAVANDWRPATTFEKLASFVCSSETAGSDRIFNSARDTVFVCGSNDEWEMLSGSFTDTRDSKKYKTIKIGTQTWMAENLRYADSSKTTNLKGRTRCFNDTKSNCDTYGPLYTYSAAMNIDKTYDTYNVSVASVVKAKHQGICPTGWHIPSVAEYETLINYVQSVAGVDSLGKNFISVSGWKYANAVSGWHLYDMAGWDSFGFNLLQAGFGTKDGSGYDYYPLQNSDQGSSMLWASDEYAGTKDVSYKAYLLKVQTDKTGNVSVQTDFWPKDGIHSVRCIKN